MIKKSIAIMVLGLAACATGSFAEEASDASIYDKIWDKVVFYENDDNKVIQSFATTGRLQADAYTFHDDDDQNNDNAEWRRFRFGFKAKLLNDFVLHAEMDADADETFSDSWDDFYNRITDAYVGWTPSKAVQVKVGKQSAGFTLDGATSSKKLIVPERSIVAGNLWFTTEYFTGAGVSGSVEDWTYKASAFSASGEDEFGHFNSGYFTLLSAGHKVGEKGTIRLDYVYNDPDYTGTDKDPDYTVGTKNLRHVTSLVYKQMLTEKLGIWTDLAWAHGINDRTEGIDQSDLLGLEIMPFYNITEKLQLVFQYAGVTSLDNHSDVKMSRYAGKNADGDKVETAHNFLLGFNWYLYGHKLKWQNAVEYNYGENLASSGDDYNGYGLTSAFRLSW